jgi:methyl-accepting chemotaxis protein
MSDDGSKRRFSRLLRRTAKMALGTPASHTASDESAFWLAHERAVIRTREWGEAAQRIAATIAKQRAAVDALADRARHVSGRAQELTVIFGRVAEVFERLGLVALNASLEGARLGEGPGRAMALVSDEVRTHALRGAESVRELSSTLTEMAGELAQLNATFDAPREASAEIGHLAATAAAACADAERALAEMDARARQATGSDPETARAIAQANEHAQALMSALASAGTRVPHEKLVSALRPMLEPLMRVLETEEDGAPPASTKAPENARGDSEEKRST